MKRIIGLVYFIIIISFIAFADENNRCSFKNLINYFKNSSDYIPMKTYDEIIVPRNSLIIEDVVKINDEDYQYLVKYNYAFCEQRIYIITSDDLSIETVLNEQQISKKIKIRLTNLDAKYKLGDKEIPCLVFDTIPIVSPAYDFPVYYFDKNECIFSLLISHLGKTEVEILKLYPKAKKITNNTIVLTDLNNLENNQVFPGFQWTITKGIVSKVNYRLYDNKLYDEQIEKTIALYGNPEFKNDVMYEWKVGDVKMFFNGKKEDEFIIYFASYLTQSKNY
ncbi:MAG: hypothetical protein IK024_00205 [Treponema sp.]|nr:hypothetical protein [Treponema sp.]